MLEQKKKVSFVNLPQVVKKDLAASNRIRFRIKSWCMFPVLWRGDIIEVIPAQKEELLVNDVLCYQADNFIYAHRIMQKIHENGQCFFKMAGWDDDFEGKSDLHSRIPISNVFGKVAQVTRRQETFPIGFIEEGFFRNLAGVRFFLFRVRLSIVNQLRKVFQNDRSR